MEKHNFVQFWAAEEEGGECYLFDVINETWAKCAELSEDVPQSVKAQLEDMQSRMDNPFDYHELFQEYTSLKCDYDFLLIDYNKLRSRCDALEAAAGKTESNAEKEAE